MIQLFFIICVG
ncbi:hypothetical protein CN324_13085 [Bacillus anthracis]|nr:hypothetical protein COM76_30255 [Bacillus cereus]PDY85972.1 hypothetical protein CON09_27035 [Bacillus anthracis]PGA25226.1 hypothetical protein COL80_16180 [Bacillus thuringiensis]PHA14452.1 hypothetical protein COE65_04890 [Bacillus sp. AFS051223]PDZ38868.1 hypothetical protein CON18_18220 [Bacillus cereus]